MGERIDNNCTYSGQQIKNDTLSLPVECPLCGAIRMIPVNGSYPKHNKRLTPAVGKKRRWKKVNEQWLIIW